MLKRDIAAIKDDTFIADQLDSVFSKIEIIDGSVDKDRLHCQLLDYYRTKFGDPDLADFQYEFIDLFCGAGGLSVGLEQEGFRPVIAVDKDRSAILTYRFNRPWLADGSIIHDDIRDLVGQDIFPHVPVVVGGPPCQGFSVVNKQKKEDDERNNLYKFYVHSVGQAQPDIFLMENVEGKLGITEADQRKDIQLLIRVLSRFSGIKEKSLPQALRNNPETVNFPIQAYITILDEFYSRGYYTENEIIYKINGNGHKHWPRTVRTQRAYPQNGSLIYLTTVARKSVVNSSNYLSVSLLQEYCFVCVRRPVWVKIWVKNFRHR